MQKKKLKLKKKARKKVFLGAIVLVLLGVVLLGIYVTKQDLSSLGYSDQAISRIFRKFKIGYVKNVGKNKTLNKAFESKEYQEDNLAIYQQITYQPHADLIANINTLLEKGYQPKEISLILARGSNSDVTAFAKKEKVKYLEEFFSIDYAKLANYDRYVAYQDKENEDAQLTVLYVNMDFDKEEYVDPVILTNFDEYTLVNKHRQLSSDYVPKQLKTFKQEVVKSEETVKAHQKVVEAFDQMQKAALADGVSLMINSGYRSYQEQEEVVATYLQAYGKNYVDNYIAKPGFSEHQTGMSIDVASKTKNIFIESEEYRWMMDHAYEYGFILRYPKSKEEITGYKCEAWHYRYVGKKIANYIKKNNITYDEYYVMFLDK